MTDDSALMLGASGFLGSHVVKALVAAGRPMRILTHGSSNTAMTDHLDLDRQIGDVFDPDTLRKAMTGCSSVFYCIVDTRSWLRDPAPLYRTNVDGSRLVIEVALETGVERFVFTSSIVTMSSIHLQRIMGDYDNSKAKSELGWEPRPMNESLKEAAIWFKENP